MGHHGLDTFERFLEALGHILQEPAVRTATR
jgi:hypothetical protein